MFMNASGSGLDNVLRNQKISFRPTGAVAVKGRQLRTVDKLLNGRRNRAPEVKKKDISETGLSPDPPQWCHADDSK
jgi:hypothetical protein